MNYSIPFREVQENVAANDNNFSVQCQYIPIDTVKEANDNEPKPVANFGKRHHPKFSMRDAHFFPYFQELRQERLTPVSIETSVTGRGAYKPTYADTLTGNHGTSPSRLLKKMGALAAAQKAARAPSPKPSKLDRSLRQRQQPVDTHLHQWKVPAPWRDLTFWFQAVHLHDAGSHLGTVHSFSLNLRPDIEELARKQLSAASWLHKRIQLELKAAYGRKVDCWFVIEAAQSLKRLHIHGEVILPGSDATLARKALRKAGGEWAQVRQHQCHTSELPDDGWVSYALKDLAWNSARSRNAPFRGFSGEPYAASQALRKSAQAEYEADRKRVIARLKARNAGKSAGKVSQR
ncbi:hypothetical protein [Phyllobacterium zundukense]|uniref:Uncharacterized protein n=1 Tax=Phyllobacterium zundukense TaxID=1867719 RepID=A0ACD4D7D5_9HYPH|nr:hypothetical protein [Phyllobacterium zundukense]UXN61715.1 hypothetical protein N8E88_16845 [Phyllobacterium zundukense]